MKKKKYEGTINKLNTHKIFLNIKHLEKGNYVLKILNCNRIIKTTTFKKK